MRRMLRWLSPLVLVGCLPSLGSECDTSADCPGGGSCTGGVCVPAADPDASADGSTGDADPPRPPDSGGGDALPGDAGVADARPTDGATTRDGEPTDGPAPDLALSDALPRDAAPPDGASPDARPEDADSPDVRLPDVATPDAALPDAGCVRGIEICNGLDDDCDGVVDDGVEYGPTVTVARQVTLREPPALAWVPDLERFGVFWADTSAAGQQLHGALVSPELQVSETQQISAAPINDGAWAPAAAGHGDRSYVAWVQGNAIWGRFLPLGANDDDPPPRPVRQLDAVRAREPAVTSDGTNVWVAWSESSRFDGPLDTLGFVRIAAGQNAALFGGGEGRLRNEPSVAVSAVDEVVLLVWRETRADAAAITALGFSFDGEPLGDPFDLAVGDVGPPRAVWTGTLFAVVYRQENRIVRHLETQPQAWRSMAISPDDGLHSAPTSAADPAHDRVGIAWYEAPAGRLVARVFGPDGRAGPAALLPAAGPYRPALAASPGGFGVAWLDSSAALPNLVFTRGPLHCQP